MGASSFPPNDLKNSSEVKELFGVPLTPAAQEHFEWAGLSDILLDISNQINLAYRQGSKPTDIHYCFGRWLVFRENR